MPRHRPLSGYARLSQADEEDDRSGDVSDEEDHHTFSTSIPQYEPIQPRSQGPMPFPYDNPSESRRKSSTAGKRVRSNSSGVDIKAINARLERWAEEITSKFKSNRVKGNEYHGQKLEIHHSMFQAPVGVRPATAETLQSKNLEGQDGRITKTEFEEVVESVRTAIELGVHPIMISQGSSGSYFARNTSGKVVGVFKPKDEEPYASRNPKWTKWIHRNLFPCFFGRACLIPNLSYVSEAAAFVLDTRLQTNLVPYTEIVHLSSKSFFYDFWQRSAFYRRRKPLPAKVGSFQAFLKGFKDANIFLREHPWPDIGNGGFRPQDAPKHKRRPWAEDCRPSGAALDEDEEETRVRSIAALDANAGRSFVWTHALQRSFREELEKLVILDYIMRNTDRGLDNWMIKVDWDSQRVSIASDPLTLSGAPSDFPRPVTVHTDESNMLDPYRRQESMIATSRSGSPSNTSDANTKLPKMSLGAIDNSLSWPWKHPDAWRSFPFGWLFLPVSLIGQPFSQKTRDHFIPLLTSTDWWSETQLSLRRVFSQDSDFKERMFIRQIAVMKGQAWNVLETLKTAGHGPLELTRRTRVCVWDDLVDVPVAIPLRTPSVEQRHQFDSALRKSGKDEDDEAQEMDISAVNGSGIRARKELINFDAPNVELPNPNRFELSRNPSSSDLGNFHDRPESPPNLNPNEPSPASTSRKGNARRPTPLKANTRASHEASRKRGSTKNHWRRYSYSTRYGNNALYDGDDLEGDLGYAAAEGMEGSQRKVIVERLETVKSKNPVFTWC